MCQAAVEYANNGWSIFPLKPRDKTPLTPHGFKDASTKLDVVRSWWTKTPTANIGLNCGKSGLVVIDLDKRGEHDGLSEWDALMGKQHLTPHTSTSLTGGGGRHLLFKAPPGIEIHNSAGRLAPGIDVRAEGGYIVLPPSIHPSGKPYCWADDSTAIEILPDPVVQILIHEPDPWPAFTLRDAFAPREPLVWIVDNIISAGSLTMWYGSPGTLKSMLLTDLAICVATGAHWLARSGNALSGIPTSPVAVMWLDFDNGQRRTHERMAALARARKVSDAAPITYYSMPRPRLAAGDSESVHALLARIVNRNVGLVIIDNLGKIAGDADENSADMQEPMDGLRWLAENGAAVVVIHHQRKSNGLGNIRAGETLRGHGSIEAALDLAMLVTRDDEEVTITPTKTRGQNISELTAVFAFENDANHELTTARFWPVDKAAAEAEEQKSLRQLIIEVLGKLGPLGANEVYQQVGGNRNHVLDVLRQMNLEKVIAKKAGPRNTTLVSLP
jgi:Bifunctional DNA primase/polymerase, N-terminal/AAA domain